MCHQAHPNKTDRKKSPIQASFMKTRDLFAGVSKGPIRKDKPGTCSGKGPRAADSKDDFFWLKNPEQGGTNKALTSKLREWARDGEQC